MKRSDSDVEAWDDLEEEEGASELQREWDSRRSRFFVHGYREGLEQGKEDALQQGFDEGFALGSRSGFHVGFAQGVYDALIGMQKQGVHHLSEKEKEFIAVMEELPPSDQLHKQILETGDVTAIDTALSAIGLDASITDRQNAMPPCSSTQHAANTSHGED